MATRPRARGRSGTAARAGVDASLAVASAAMNTNFARAWSAREQARAWAWAERITALSASRHCPPSFRRPSSGSGLCPLVRIAPASGSSILPQDALRFAPDVGSAHVGPCPNPPPRRRLPLNLVTPWRAPAPRWRRNPPVGFIRPCEPTLAARPPSGPGWLHEIKHDGFRILARKQGEQVKVWSRRGLRGDVSGLPISEVVHFRDLQLHRGL
jgi:hypothetical protein